MKRRAAPPLGDYLCLADGRTAALVTTSGSCHFWCGQGFDGPLRLARLLDWDGGGSVGVAPVGLQPREAGWEHRTVVLRSTFGEQVRLRCGLVDDGAGGSALCWVLEGPAGLPIELQLTSPTAARGPVWAVGEGGAHLADEGPADGPRGPLVLVASQPLELTDRTAGLQLSPDGLTVWLGLGRPDQLPPQLALARRGGAMAVREAGLALDRRAEEARDWVEGLAQGERLARCLRRSPSWAGEALIRSLLTLSGLQDRSSGLLVASPTTSIPQWPASERAWDYRYAWLRDCADAGMALARAGALVEARRVAAGLAGLLSAPAGAPVSRLGGGPLPPEHTLEYLEGYGGAVVRVGNGASEQAQVDTLGEVAQLAFRLDWLGGCPDPLLEVMPRLADRAAAGWAAPDHGIWEIRGQPRHYVHSKLLALTALDRAIRLARRGRIRSDSVDRWRAELIRISSAVEARGRNQDGALTIAFDDPGADSSALATYLVGYPWPAGVPASATLDFVTGRLQQGHLLHRHQPQRDGLPSPCAPFLFTTLWAVIAEARLGRRDQALERLRAVLELAGPAGQLSEVADPDSGLMLGNYPQVQSHAAVVEAVMELFAGSP